MSLGCRKGPVGHRRVKAVALLLGALLASSALLAGCSFVDGGSSAASSGSSHGAISIQVEAPDTASQALAEAESLYQESHDWVTFSNTAKDAAALSTELSTAISTSQTIVIAPSEKSMDAAEGLGTVDASTRSDLMRNELEIISAATSSIRSCTMAEIASGARTCALGATGLPCGTSARQALAALSAYTAASGQGGSYTGAVAAARSITEQPTTATLFGIVQEGSSDVALAYSSDVYRYGGVKVVGSVDPSTYDAVQYPIALSAQASGDVKTQAEDFETWCLTDQGAIQIWKKWGFETIA